MFRVNIATTVMLLGFLAGCAGMSEQECLVTDWRAVGFEDGASGRAETVFGSYRNSCGEHGIAPNFDQYRLGHAEGVKTYCRPGRAFEVGRRGGRYQGVCPVELESEFLAAYADGQQLYDLEVGLRSIDNQIAANERRIQEIESALASTAAAIIAEGTGAVRRAELLLETDSLKDERARLEADNAALEVERLLAYDALMAYQETLAYR